QHRSPGEPQVQQRSNGRWVMVSERRTDDGGTVSVYSDITELKQREQDLTEKSKALAALSSKLAKYLAPQVYDSIFTGQQDVKIVSKRKKLTVCFSDLVGFTEITDKMESEDLTALLNHYLTEMSKIALQYVRPSTSTSGMPLSCSSAIRLIFGVRRMRLTASKWQSLCKNVLLNWSMNGAKWVLLRRCNAGLESIPDIARLEISAVTIEWITRWSVEL